MAYKDLVKDPLLVAVMAAFIGVLFAHLYGVWKQGRKRKSSLIILRHQLENHESLLRKLRSNLGENKVCNSLDPVAITNFINSDVVDLPKDEKLISTLYEHLDNIENIKNVLEIVRLRSVGFLKTQGNDKSELENNLAKKVGNIIDDLHVCIGLIKT